MPLLQSVRLAFRLFRRDPALTGIALASIALSAGASTVVFAAVKSVLLDPLPFARPSQLVQLRSEFPRMRQQSHGDWVVWNDTRELGRRSRTLGPAGAYANAVFDLAGDSTATPEALYGVRMSAVLFPVLGVSPMLGRNVLPDEDRPGQPDVIILSYGLWVRRFHSDASIVGRHVTINGHACKVIGVMPPRFNFPLRREAAHTPSPYVEFWAAPLAAAANPNAGMGAVARLRPGIPFEAARRELASLSNSLAHDFPATNRDRILTASPLLDSAVGAAGKSLWLLLAATAVFLLIGCANVANLLLARGFARQREIAVRLALGAGYWRIVGQLLTESSLLALAGGFGGYLLSLAAWSILPLLTPASIPRLAASRSDGAVLAFALAVAILNGILFGIAPALRLAAENPSRAWSGFGSRGAASGRRDGLRSSLVASEVALSALLVVVGGQVLANFAALAATDPGFETTRVLASVVLPARERYPTDEKRALFYRRILDAVRAVPGVENAGTVDALPFSGENHGGTVSGGAISADNPLTAEIDVAGGDYLRTMGVRLLQGRWFRQEEMQAPDDAAIVNTFVADRLWPHASALGQRICVFCTPENPRNWKRVIGVVSHTSHGALDEPGKGNVYLAAGAMEKAAFLVVRTERPKEEVAKAIRQAIAAIDPNQPVLLTASMRQLVSDSIAARRFLVALLTVTGCLALFLAAAGIYGVISYTTSRRTQEIGIRMAVGATPAKVFSLIFRQGFLVTGVGLIIGLAGAMALLRILERMLFGLTNPRPPYLLAAAALVAVTAEIACWVPARRATRTDPMAALRRE
ncbi:MAG: ABC transporter permease [Bryobacterales bacterium]|nr:ABC transporter permease [Bryobacterales bacterium]